MDAATRDFVRNRDVLRMVVGSGLRMATCGMAIGLAGALFVTRVSKTFL